MHLYIPNLKNYDDYGGRKKSEMMITSVHQTIDGKIIFRDIELANPSGNSNAANKSFVNTEINKYKKNKKKKTMTQFR